MLDPWYKRSEFWVSIVSLLQLPAFALIPTAGPIIQVAAGVIATIIPAIYVKGRSDVKAAAITANLPVAP